MHRSHQVNHIRRMKIHLLSTGATTNVKTTAITEPPIVVKTSPVSSLSSSHLNKNHRDKLPPKPVLNDEQGGEQSSEEQQHPFHQDLFENKINDNQDENENENVSPDDEDNEDEDNHNNNLLHMDSDEDTNNDNDKEGGLLSGGAGDSDEDEEKLCKQ